MLMRPLCLSPAVSVGSFWSVRPELSMGLEVTVAVTIDHGQFIACDPEAKLDIDSYSERAMRQGLAMWGRNGGVTIFTASHWTDTDVTVSLSPGRPTIKDAQWDHIVEGGLVVTSGSLHLYGPEDTGTNEASIAVAPRTYSLIVCGRDFDSTNEYGDEGDDCYALLLWPGPVLERRVLKDGFPWRG
jgi:hypothetical protein